MAGVRGDFSKLSRMKATLRALPTSVAHVVAQRAAPLLTNLTQSAFAAGRNVYGDERPRGKGGRVLDLEVTGDARRTLRFTSSGTLVRCVLGKRYIKYLIGKYQVLPNGGRSVPAEWERNLTRTAEDVFREQVRG